ncbi:AMP-binding protein [Virgibacillus sp. NKC19-3]|uniref:acyl-CoA synthetase MbcS n=1 Tax=Virgibacillus saliphilus TaxID=2831674 RepID=UPI001C9B169E|nr:AMP-binding protein [Virgibacillus sp. NKC19-3]MBY7142736.1 AMP-binding protein [Virgibacillus sp. NKC19-3]
MKKEELIAPKDYNIVMEMERYATDPGRKALIWQDDKGNTKEITYADLIRNVNRIGNVFLENGLKRGDKILVMIPRFIEAYEVYLAALKTGIIIIPSSEMLKTRDLQYRISHGEVRGVVSYFHFVDQYKGVREYDQLIKFAVGGQADGWHFLDRLKADASDQLDMVNTTRDDIAFLPYTSGTTSNPKGVIHTHGWGYAHLKAAAENWLAINEGDKVWATAGPGWQKWIWSPFLSVLGSGATGFVYNGKFDPKTYLRLLQDKEINVLCCTPTEYRIMAKVDNLEDYHFPALHSAVSAGEPLNVEVIDTFRRYFDITVRDGYGQTENTLLLGFPKGMEVRPGSMGKPTPGNDVEVINEEGLPARVNEVGDIAVKLDSPALFQAYYKDMERTKMSQRGDYYITGDQASKDEDGYFWFEGRRDDIIISSGYTIGPFEVEDALVKHPYVQECAVVASPDDIRGNLVKAFVVLKESVDKNSTDLVKELQDHVKDTTAPYKYPRRIEFIEELPKTTSGKIRRVELREKEKQVH